MSEPRNRPGEGPGEGPGEIVVIAVRNQDRWVQAFTDRFPDRKIVLGTQDATPESVEYLVGWKIDWAQLGNFPNLKGVMLTSAGIDHLDFSLIPSKLPVVRLIDPSMSTEIAAYCTHWVVHYARSFDVYAKQQQAAVWEIGPRNPEVTVGILGLGAIGTVVANHLTSLGYPVISWSRSEKDTSYGQHHVGNEALTQFFAASNTVVNLLPLSDATKNIVGEAALRALGDGVLINVGRGGTVDTNALLDALSGDLHAAVLDVFATEPLPADSPLWSHPKVAITPHIAGETNPFTAVKVIGANIDLIDDGKEPYPLVTAATY